ncbi:MAG: hypothetical protein LIP09_16095 [Bacteroidales bacterium]|nr:hypothetical protein [Bacteroidales bacterium]
MKTELRTSGIGLALGAAMLIGATGCNDDWGQKDPEAGNQVYPTLQTVATYAFEDEEGEPSLQGWTLYNLGADPASDALVDEIVASPVLSLDNAYASIENPLNSVTCQAAACVTFWMKQPIAYDEEGNALTSQDINTPLIAFVNPYIDGSVYSRDEDGEVVDIPVSDDAVYGSLAFTANGMIHYDATDGEFTDNDPDEYKTGYFTPDEWHYVALVIRSDGYGIYVDGMRKVDKVVPKFDCMKMVEFMNNASKVYLNYNTSEAPALLIDDLTFYRNEITSKQIASPKKGNAGGGSTGGEEEEDTTNWVMVGLEDNTTGWWSAWSESVNLTGDGTIHFDFINYTNQAANWDNWLLVLTPTGYSPNDGDKYGEELLVLRSDAYGWGTYYNGDNITHDYNWDTFTSDMQGAHVVIDVTRSGSTVTMKAVTTTADGQTFNYGYTFEYDGGNLIGAFLTVEGGHLMVYGDEVFVGQTYSSKQYVLGNEDFSNTFWSCWTPMVKMETPFKNYGFQFVNHSACGGNWQFWNFVCTNGMQSGLGEDGYYEYYYLRCDAYGWGDLYGSSEMTANFDWDTFISDMNGATSRIYFTYENGTLTLVARQNRADGTEIPEYRFVTPGVSLPVGLIFTCEGSWLDFQKVGYFPWADLTPKATE